MIKFFSIIIPVYNVAPYLRECLDSVIAQTFTEWEAICVDDGSTDGSGAILDEYSAKDARLKVIHKTNGGVSTARNIAMGIASGTYVVFVDADDVLMQDWLSAFFAVIKKESCDVVRGALRYWYGEDLPKRNGDRHYSVVARFNGRKDICDWGIAEVLKTGYPVLNCIRREILDGVTFPAGVRIMEDCIFNLHIITRADTVSVIDNEGYLYRMRENSAVHLHSKKQSIVLDLKDFFVALKNFWLDSYKSICEEADLKHVRKVITKLVFRKIMISAVANRRCLNSPNEDFGSLAKSVGELEKCEMLDLRALSTFEGVALKVFMKKCDWNLLLLLWKVWAATDKLKKFKRIRYK